MKKPRHNLKLPQPRPAKIQPANQMIWGNGKIKHHVTTEKTAQFPYQFRFFRQTFFVQVPKSFLEMRPELIPIIAREPFYFCGVL